jgi:hypothetical protein
VQTPERASTTRGGRSPTPLFVHSVGLGGLTPSTRVLGCRKNHFFDVFTVAVRGKFEW